ncbi:MAG: hypothetical protein HOE90_08120 [Bacteriovoracaceae bacterium]|nr:hypothetical protein [Bacteriovoracaceae bacterium]
MNPFVYSLVFIELLLVSYGDFKWKKISNYWSLLNITLFICLLFILPATYSINLKTFIYPLGFLGVGFTLFILNIMGGGDSKFLSTFYLLIPLSIQDSATEFLLYSTASIGGMLMIKNFIKNHKSILLYIKLQDYKSLKNYFGSKFSFAPVILIAWVIVGWSMYVK